MKYASCVKTGRHAFNTEKMRNIRKNAYFTQKCVFYAKNAYFTPKMRILRMSILAVLQWMHDNILAAVWPQGHGCETDFAKFLDAG